MYSPTPQPPRPPLFFSLSVAFKRCCLSRPLAVLGHTWAAFKISCLFQKKRKKKEERDSCPVEKMLLIFMRGLCYDEKYIAEFIFICLSGKSEPRPMRHMINEHTRTGVHQDLYPSSEACECPQRLRRQISFPCALPPLSLFNMFIVCLLTSRTFKHTESQVVMTLPSRVSWGDGARGGVRQSNNEQIGYNS